MDPKVQVPDAVLERFRKITAATAYSGVWRLRPSESAEWFASATWQRCLMHDVWPQTPGRRIVGRARTLRYLPPRPDLLEITRQGADSAEYRAMGRCGPGDVLVIEAHSADPYACAMGNMKTRQLWHNQAEGIVSDAAIRDLDLVAEYGLGVFAKQRSPAGNLPFIEGYEENEPINCGGVLVMPGDVIIADDDGVVVVPAQHAEKVIDWIEEQEAAEAWVTQLIDEERVPPGKYYPISEETKQRFRESQQAREDFTR